MSKKTVFIIPGYKHTPKHKAYKSIAKLLKKEGHLPIPVTIPWRQTTISENTKVFLKEYKKIKTKNKYILGFSFGAMIAFLASTKVPVKGLILCSLSPYFKEDLVNTKRSMYSSISRQRYQDFLQLKSLLVTRHTKAKQILMIYGTLEAKPLINRVTKAYRQLSIPQKYLIPIPKTDHHIGDKRYLYAIHQIAKVLN